MKLYFQDLPMGKYRVCGEAHKEGHVVQANCFETVIDRLDNNSEKITVIIMMVLRPPYSTSIDEHDNLYMIKSPYFCIEISSADIH